MHHLIPRPRSVEWLTDETHQVDGWRLVGTPPALSTYADAAAAVLAGSADEPERRPVVVAHDDSLPSEGYRLHVRPEGVDLAAADARGLLHGARTLADLLDASGGSVPAVAIEDHPEIAWRGILVESYWGSDMMTLEDWQTLIDRLAGLKLNVLAISLYGCWDLRHDRDRGEFQFVPLSDFPELQTPHRYRTWDPSSRTEIQLDYLPRMFSEDLFASVAAYATSRGMRVVPLFGGPGHSSYLPRAVPGLSAVTEEGSPTGFGYCVTDPGRTEVLLSVFRNLVEQHLLPQGITTLAIPGDEFYPIINVDPDDPMREYSPYCRCCGCRDLTPGELLIRYLTLVGDFLAGYGIRMLNWQDSLVREDAVPAYADALRDSDALRPIVSWWRYNEPIPVIEPHDAWDTWVTPSPGVIGSLFAQNFALNIEQMLRSGLRAGVDGVLAYSMPDPAMHRNFAYLADAAWRHTGSGGAVDFDARWAARVCPEAPEAVGLAYRVGDSVIASYPLMNYLANHLLPYFSTAPYGATTFPDDLVRPLSVATPAFTSVLRQIRDTMRESMALMPPIRPIAGWPDPRETWLAEGERLAAHADLFLRLIELSRRLHDESLADLEEEIVALEAAGEALLEHVAATKVSYQRASVLREHLGLVGELRPALARLAAEPAKLAVKTGSWHAWLF
ncbi:glycoside hydrolase family 20 zincin-like fold domain-containing protein [Pseudactinotalea suaedae]|uniref:glycoside hydrolase family 20 zincin-like fold domain-containing protein n=1 Tax=Pseudactinotalea suaedae TaxID=1524924 RepID=UPI001390A923|nr:glycoside hydrolase family 20 zincin-like fold domain-containing protein [Pseudactinotalea suaedae]